MLYFWPDFSNPLRPDLCRHRLYQGQFAIQSLQHVTGAVVASQQNIAACPRQTFGTLLQKAWAEPSGAE